MKNHRQPLNIIEQIARCFRVIFLSVVMIFGAVTVLLILPSAETNAAPEAEPPFPTTTEAVTQALKALVTLYQNGDGGYASFSPGANVAPSNTDGTADAILAIAAAGDNPNIPYPGRSSSPIAWMKTHPISVANYAATRGDAAGKIALALVAANLDPRDFEGYNFVISTTDQLSVTGQFENIFSAYGQGLAMVGLKAAGEPVPIAAAHWLTGQQTITGNFGADPDDVGMALMGLLAAGVPTDDMAIISATAYLSDTQLPSGGWRPIWDTVNDANANSTSLIYQAFLALGEDAGPGSQWDKDGATPLDGILEMQNTNGAFLFFGVDSFFSTAQAIPAATGQFYPFPVISESVVVDQNMGGALVHIYPSGNMVQLDIPAGAVSQTTELRLQPITPLPGEAPTSTLLAGHLFAIEAYQGGVLQQDFAFTNPVTLTLRYSDGNVAAVDEESLQLYYWTGTEWLTDSVALVERNPDQNELILTIGHLTDFALFGEAIGTYLPLIIKD